MYIYLYSPSAHCGTCQQLTAGAEVQPLPSLFILHLHYTTRAHSAGRCLIGFDAAGLCCSWALSWRMGFKFAKPRAAESSVMGKSPAAKNTDKSPQPTAWAAVVCTWLLCPEQNLCTELKGSHMGTGPQHRVVRRADMQQAVTITWALSCMMESRDGRRAISRIANYNGGLG